MAILYNSELWGPGQVETVLLCRHVIPFRLPTGNLTCTVGKTGQGKSYQALTVQLGENQTEASSGTRKLGVTRRSPIEPEFGALPGVI